MTCFMANGERIGRKKRNQLEFKVQINKVRRRARGLETMRVPGMRLHNYQLGFRLLYCPLTVNNLKNTMPNDPVAAVHC